MSDAEIDMPVYVCHKEVHALKIAKVRLHGCKGPRAGALIPEDNRYGLIEVSEEYMNKHAPEAGGYYVVYKDGYKSFSPAQAFEEGYTLKK